VNGTKPTKPEAAHMARIKAMRCICCELLGQEQTSPSDVHHIREHGQARNHWLTLPLCHADCHQGRNGVEFERTYLRILKMTEFDLLARVIERMAKAEVMT
jgi:hypothetical protein